MVFNSARRRGIDDSVFELRFFVARMNVRGSIVGNVGAPRFCFSLRATIEGNATGMAACRAFVSGSILTRTYDDSRASRSGLFYGEETRAAVSPPIDRPAARSPRVPRLATRSRGGLINVIIRIEARPRPSAGRDVRATKRIK